MITVLVQQQVLKQTTFMHLDCPPRQEPRRHRIRIVRTDAVTFVVDEAANKLPPRAGPT